MKSVSFHSQMVALLLIGIGCGPAPVSKKSQEGSTTTSTTEFAPVASGQSNGSSHQDKIKAAIVKLLKVPESAEVLRYVRPADFESLLPAPAKEVVLFRVRLSTGDEIRAKNGHSGGGIERADDGSFVIHANVDADEDLLAHTLRHEMNHIIQDIQMDVLKDDQRYQEIVRGVVAALKTRKKEAIAALPPKHLEYVLAILMCAEIRSYETNRRLDAAGVPFRPFSFEKTDLDQFVNTKYLEPYFWKFSEEQASKVGQQCRAQKYLMDFHKLISPLLD